MFGRLFNRHSQPLPPDQNAHASAHSGLDLPATSIISPDQLPPVLSLGDRDDATFTRDGSTWSCLYRFDREPFTQVGWNGRMWELTRFWQGRNTATTYAPAHLSLSGAISLHFQYLSAEVADDPYEKLLKERSEAETAVHYWLPRPGSTIGVGVPGGRFKGIAFPVNSASSAILKAHSDELSLRFNATLVLTEGERSFQLVTRGAPEQLAEQIVSELSATYGSRITQPRIASMAVEGTRIWRTRFELQTALAYIFQLEHGLLDLIDALRAWGVLPPLQPDSDGTALLIMHGGVVAGLVEFVGQSSVYRYHPWLRDMPTAAATFPPCPQAAFEQAMSGKTAS